MHEKLELRIHLAGCSDCRIFEQQSLVINKLVHDLFDEPKATKLDNEFKKKVQDQIMEKPEKIKSPNLRRGIKASRNCGVSRNICLIEHALDISR